MKISAAIAGGLAGTLAIASLHEAFRRVTPDAPRMDKLDMDLISKAFECIDRKPPEKEELQRWAVTGELVCDSAYYSLAGIGHKDGAWMRGAILGLIAGITAVVLPKPLGLPTAPSNKTLNTKIMTVVLYLTGGLVSAGVSKLVEEAQDNEEDYDGNFY